MARGEVVLTFPASGRARPPKSLPAFPVKPRLSSLVLATYAVTEKKSKGRKYPESEHPIRRAFQRDRDRIIHSTAFRRLQYKTQVFVNHEGDHYRTRLTHTLETSQIARTLARALNLNEDLVEAISLAHDIGHGPFGHAGEWALRDLMKNYGGFEHNAQALRILEKLEARYPDFPGLNLSFETLEGLKKHPAQLPGPYHRPLRMLEAEVVDLADEIAYTSHDLDDGLRSGLLRFEDLGALPLWRASRAEAQERAGGMLAAEFLQPAVIRRIIDRLVRDVLHGTLLKIRLKKLRTFSGLQKIRMPLVRLSDNVRRDHTELKRFLRKNLYEHPHVRRRTDEGQQCIRALFNAYLKRPERCGAEVLKRAGEDGLQRSVCDYVAGMTDRYAIQEYKHLFGMQE